MGSAVPSYDLGSGEVTHQQCMDTREATPLDLDPVEAGSPACLGCHRRRRRRLAQVFLAVDLNRGEQDGEEDRPEEESDQPVGRQAAEDAEEEEQRSEEHTSELQSLAYLVCRLLLEKKKRYTLE